MFPWIWIFAPQSFWPLSGPVDVSPDAFFRGIRPGAGVPAVEKRVFEQASYGKQLGWLTDVVVEALGSKTLKSAEAQWSLTSLKNLQSKIEIIKSEHTKDRTSAAIALLDQMQADNPEELKSLLGRYQGERAVSRKPPART